MNTSQSVAPVTERELFLSRLIDAPPPSSFGHGPNRRCSSNGLHPAHGPLYTARVRHWSVADRLAHEKMGFHEGWGKATDQLAELVATL